MICGVDEAGRGPVIGPLVVAGVLVDEEGLRRLRELEVRDSKLLTPSRREELYKEITAFAGHQVIKTSARELDGLMGSKSLNQIEADLFAKVISGLSPESAYVDAADVSCRNFERMILKAMKIKPLLVVEHKADERYPAVSAASIVAKVERDREIARLHEIHGDFGSGYASDERTRKFLDRCFRRDRSFPDCVRKRWKTAIRASNLKLEEFY